MRQINRLILLFTITLTLTACSSPKHHPNAASSPNATATSQVIRSVPVETARVKTGLIRDFIETTGNLKGINDVVIYPKITGQIEAIYVEEGDQVNIDTILASIDDDELIIAAEQAKVAMMQAEEKFLRMQSLYEDEMVSEESFRDEKYSHENSKLNYQLAQLNLKYSKIRSPISGVITQRDIGVGDLVQLSSSLFRIVNQDELEMNVHLPEQDAQRVSTGLPVEILSDSLGDQLFNARVSRINPIVDPKTGTIKITIKLTEHYPELMPGMFVKTKIILNSHKSAVLLPKESVIRDNGDMYVFTVTDDNRVNRTKVITGLENSKYFQIIDGIDQETIIVVVGQQGLEEGDRVNDSSSTSESDQIQTKTPNPGIQS